jgi:hypothetical protein
MSNDEKNGYEHYSFEELERVANKCSQEIIFSALDRIKSI